jgi:hypothetical protein
MDNVIKFYPWDKNAEACTLPPEPAIKGIPDQWKNFSRYTDENHMTVKHCMPFFDALTAGYNYLLPCDITVAIINDIPKITWDHEITPLTVRSNKEISAPVGCYDMHFSWQMWWGIKLPEGWSALITGPLNHNEIPFQVTSGIVDFDVYTAPGNIGFFIKKGFEGKIVAGTPIFQIIPIQRSSWKMVIDLSIAEQGRMDHGKKKVSPPGYYKKTKRVDKKYT